MEKTGWHCGVYVLPDEVIGPGGDNVILQGSHYLTGGFAQAGTLAEWQEQVAALCAGNSRLAFAVCCALAAPLLRLTGTGGGGFHLRGESTDGKTTVMKVAASVCGGTDYWHSWRATGNALEGIASRHNDALLPLDELREVAPREAGMIAYMLANGQGKGRARTDGEVRNRRHWTLLLFSTGSCRWRNIPNAPENASTPEWTCAWYKSPATPGSMVRLSSYTVLPAASNLPMPSATG